MRWLPPVVAYLVGHVIAAVGAGRAYPSTATDPRYDGDLYLSIASRGYELVSCDEVGLGDLYGPQAWCGNAGWFPLYPWLTRLVHLMVGWELAAWIVAELATLGMLFLFWTLLLRLSARPGYAPLAVLALLPGGIHFHTPFPLSLAVVGMLGYVLFLYGHRPLHAGLCGAVAAMAYPLGVAIVVVGAVVWIALPRRRLLDLASLCLLPLAGTLVVFAAMHRSVGRWNAYFLVQSHYQETGHNPVANFAAMLTGPARPPRPDPPADLVRLLRVAVPLEMVVVLAVVVVVAWLAVARMRVRAAVGVGGGDAVPEADGPDERQRALDLGLAVFAVSLFVVPLAVGGHISQYRSHLLLVPALLVLRHAPRPVTWSVAAAMAPLAVAMAVLYYPSMLI